MDQNTGTSAQGALRLEPSSSHFSYHSKQLSGEQEGVTEIEITFSSKVASIPKRTRVIWSEPSGEVHHKWSPGLNEGRQLNFKDTKTQHCTSRANESAPVVCLYKVNGENTVLFALSDAVHESKLSYQITDEGTLECGITLFQETWESIKNYTVILRIDRRPLPMQKCLKDCARWWDRFIPGSIGDIPEGAQAPRYNIRGKLNQVSLEQIEEISERAKELGFETFSFGAGWPEISSIEPASGALEDLKTYCECLKEKGLKSLARVNPFICGDDIFEKYKHMLIGARDAIGELIDPSETFFDFRFPEVRKLVIGSCEHLLKTTGLDGMIITLPQGDEIDQVHHQEDPSQDFFSFNESLAKFLLDLRKSLRNIHPDVLIEVQQPTTGPHILKAANMVRAAHTGNSFTENRKRILDIRMLCGRVVPHSSPVAWNPSERIESAAMQMTHVLFGVPQVSAKLNKLPADHLDMLEWQLSFWSEHSDVILKGKLTALDPQNGFPLVLSVNKHKLLGAVYSNAVIPLPKELPRTIVLVNGTYRDHIILEHDQPLGPHDIEVRTCSGERLLQRCEDFGGGLNRIDVPISGSVTMKKVDS